jgi:2-hydroxychromene-2-carboxylate isomerase
MPQIEFFFDFISPFGYAASLRIDELAARHGRDCAWSSILLGVSVLKVMGMKPLPTIPLKGDYLKRDFTRYARRHGIVIARELGALPSNPVSAGRAFHWLKHAQPDAAKPFAKAVFEAYWREGLDIGEVETLLRCGEKAGVEREGLREALEGELAADFLRRAVEQSLARGVFGSPYFVVDGDEPFFGLEKMELMEEWLARGGW